MNDITKRIRQIMEKTPGSREDKERAAQQFIMDNGIGIAIPQEFGNAAVGFVKGGASFHGGMAPDGEPTIIVVYRTGDGKMATINLSFSDDGSLADFLEAVSTMATAHDAKPDTDAYRGTLPDAHAMMLQFFGSRMRGAEEDEPHPH